MFGEVDLLDSTGPAGHEHGVRRRVVRRPAIGVAAAQVVDRGDFGEMALREDECDVGLAGCEHLAVREQHWVARPEVCVTARARVLERGENVKCR